DPTHTIEFTYDPSSPLILERAEMLEGGAVIEVVRYVYNSRGELESVEDERLGVTRESYVYSDDEEIEDDPPARAGLATFCRDFCAPSSRDTCGGGSNYCEDKVADVRQNCPADCQNACGDDCSAYVDGRIRSEAIEECIAVAREISDSLSLSAARSGCAEAYDENVRDPLFASCVEGCEPECTAYYHTCFSRSDCGDACEVACLEQASDGSYVYGRLSDLANNLVTVTDGAGCRMMNEYGTDPRRPNIDAVVRQYF